MKSKVALLSLVSLLFTFASVAQEIENDDMYFNSKDRAKLSANKATEPSYTASIKKTKKEPVEEQISNPTDSYSARNVNPEYEARSNSETAQADNEDYFVNNYQYNNATKLNTWNNDFNRWYTNPWYGGNYYDPYIASWNSPYYGSYYDAWGSPWGNPYYRSGWSSSFSYHWGNSWNYGWGMNYGFGNYCNPYNAWAGTPYYGYSPWGYSYYNGWGYPNQVVVIESGNRYGPAYGKRGSRSSEVSRDYVNRSGRTYNRDTQNPDTSRPITGGRVGTTTSRQSDYYNRTWRNQSQNSSSYGNSNSYDNSNSGNSRSSWESDTRSSWRDSNSGGSSSRSYDNGRSSTGGSSGGSSGGGSSSGSRSSGRGH
jgi:hypothetical protein